MPKEYVTKGGNSGKDGVLLETYNENGDATTEFVETTIYEATETEYYLDDTVLRAGVHGKTCRQQDRFSDRRV